MTANATSDLPLVTIAVGRSASVALGIELLDELAWIALTEDRDADEADDDEVESAAFDCLQTLLAPIEPYRGQRRKAEHFRKLDRAALMLAEGGLAWAHYAAGRTRRETAADLRLSVRQLRTRESFLQRAIDYFQLAWTVGPAFRGRPVLSGWRRASGGRPGTRRHLASQLGISERMLYRFLHELDDTIHVDVVDRVLCNAATSTTLRDLYADWYDRD
jgi:hypothetical protein